MKNKNSSLLFILLLAGLTATAQIQKGNWFLNGLNILSFQSGSEKSTFDGTISKSTFTDFSIGPFSTMPNLENAPSLNYGITNNLTGGIFLSLYTNKSGGTSTMFVVGPTVRYYFMDQKKFLPYAEGRLGIGSTSSSGFYSDKQSLFGWYLGTGATYFFVPKVGIDLTLGYNNVVENVKNSDNKYTWGFVAFGVGMLVVF